MSEPWEPPGQQPRAAEPSAPTGGLEPTGALPPTYPTHPTAPPVYPGYPAASSEQAQPTGPPASAGYPASASRGNVIAGRFRVRELPAVIAAVRAVQVPAGGALLGALVITQVGLGIANVQLALPLPVAVLHNAVAALLLFLLVGLVARVRVPDA